MLQLHSEDVQGQVIGVDFAAGKVEPIRLKHLAVVHDEDTADVQLDVATVFLGLKHAIRGRAGNDQQSTRLKLALEREVLPRQASGRVGGFCRRI